MGRKVMSLFLCAMLNFVTFAQEQKPQSADEKPIRITAELVQLDVVVTDKNGQVVKGLTKDDFEVFDNGKKQSVSFFEFVDLVGGNKAADKAAPQPATPDKDPDNLTEADTKRVMAFLVDDLTIRTEDMTFVREMMARFVRDRMGENDLVAIIRVVGGKGLLQQFTNDKRLLTKAIESLTPSLHFASRASASAETADLGGRPAELNALTSSTLRGTAAGGAAAGAEGEGEEADLTAIADQIEQNQELGKDVMDEARLIMRATMLFGSADYWVDSMKELPGRKSLVLISGGIPSVANTTNFAATGIDIPGFIDNLTDRATRAGVAIHTMDVRGLSANSGVASFAETPGKSALPTTIGELARSGSSRSAGTGFGRVPDERLLGTDTLEDRMGLRQLASATGGIAVFDKNNFGDGLNKIIEANQSYYLLAYQPIDTKFDGKFHKLEVKVKRPGMKVYDKRGYFARKEAANETALTKQQQILAAIKSPLAKRAVNVNALLTYRAAPLPKAEGKDKVALHGAVDIHMLIDPKNLKFEAAGDKQQVTYDVAGFVFDEVGKMRGGFSETVTVSLDQEEYERARVEGLNYTADTVLPPGAYQVRLAVRDNRSGAVGTVQKYVEIPNLSDGRLTSSHLLIVGAPPNNTASTETTVIGGNRRVASKLDLRYLMMLYNVKLKDGKSQAKGQMVISQNGKELYRETDADLQQMGNNSTTFLKMGQIGLSRVKPGRYTITITLTDPLADKRLQSITRSTDFIVVK